eukprot:COSAG02_NODE_1004_length_15275_cov_11.955917_13_plen_112_part_00
MSLFLDGREALLADPSVVPALETLAKDALSQEAAECAQGALMALGVRHVDSTPTDGAHGPCGHIMLSYQVCTRPAVSINCPVPSIVHVRLALLLTPSMGGQIGCSGISSLR